MAYEPTEWKTGDVVTSAKLNKLEQGVANAGGVMIVHDVDGVLDKTWEEIDAAAQTMCVLLALENVLENGHIQTLLSGTSIEMEPDTKYIVSFGVDTDYMEYGATTADGELTFTRPNVVPGPGNQT